MPLIRRPTTQELTDHFFGSGAFQYGWFDTYDSQFPATVWEIDDDGEIDTDSHKIIRENDFVEGIKQYAETLPDRSFDDLIEDMDAGDVDNVIQLIFFGEIRYS